MRHLVYLLLLANLAYLGWNLYQKPASSELVRELPPLPVTARPLVMLQELQQQQEEQQRSQQEQERQQERKAQQDNDLQGEQMAEQEEEDVAVLDIQGRTVEAELEAVAAIEALTQAEPPSAGVPLLCQALGPFLAVEQLETVAERLGEQGLETRRRSAETRLENGWWVYLPAMPRAEAKKIAQLLDDNNDREYFIGKDNFISLGTFRVLSRAERRLKSARKLGLEPVLEPRYKTQTRHWLDLRLAAAREGDLAWIAEDYPDLELEPQTCR